MFEVVILIPVLVHNWNNSFCQIRSFLEDESKYNFLKKILEDINTFVGSLISLFWTSGLLWVLKPEWPALFALSSQIY